jgi:hypothetical protein
MSVALSEVIIDTFLDTLSEEESSDLETLIDELTEEEFEQLDELSKKTLQRYVSKAKLDEASKSKLLDYISRSSIDKSQKAADIETINSLARATGTTAKERKERGELAKSHGNRSKGIQLAARKLAGWHVVRHQLARRAKVPATEETEMAGKTKKVNEELNEQTNPTMARYVAIISGTTPKN